METEVAKVVAERQLRRQHIPMPWTKADAADHARWTRHDNEGHEKKTGLRYAECPKCWTDMISDHVGPDSKES